MFVDEGGNKRTRQTNVEINLVPFIDLMSVSISFLLITAVWTQVSMIQIGSSIYGKRTDSGQVDQPPKEQVALRLDVNDRGYTVRLGSRLSNIPKTATGYDQDALINMLKDFKTKYPDKTDGLIALLDSIKFDELIRGMDAMMIAGFPEIAIATQGSQ